MAAGRAGMKEVLCGMAYNDDIQAKLDALIDAHRGKKDDLMKVLQSAQSIVGCVPYDVQVQIATGLGVTLSDVYGVATFYSQFTLEPQGRNAVSVCMGTACYVKNAQKILDKLSEELKVPVGRTTPDGNFTLLATRCLGCCGLAPVMMIGDDVYGRLTPAEIPGILAKYAEK